jgi:hypothetical protein
MNRVLLTIVHVSGVAGLALFYHHAAPRPRGASPVATSVVAGPNAAAAAIAAPRLVVQMRVPAAAATSPAVSLDDQITAALKSRSAAEHDRALYELVPRLVAEDPAAAGQLALAWESGPLRDELLRQVIHQWSEKDIGGVLTWLTSLLDTHDRDLAAVASAAQVAQTDPAGALDLAQVLRVGLEDGSFEHLAQFWTEQDPRAAMDWVQAQPPGPLRDRLLGRIAWVRAQSEPAEAANLALTQISAGPARTAAVVSVVRQWAVREPADAAEWVAYFPAGPLRDRAAAELEVVRRMTVAR